MNIVAPAISGQAVVGQELTAIQGTWSNPYRLSYRYVWQDCSAAGAACVPINGATTSGYSVAASDLASTLEVTVTASDAGGSASASSAATVVISSPSPPSSASVASAATGVVTDQPPVPTQPTDGISMRQVVPASCLAQPTGTLALSSAVDVGDDLFLVVGGQGYTGAASTVSGVSDNVNGAWTQLSNSGSNTLASGSKYVSGAIYELKDSKAAPTGLTVTISSTEGQSGISGVVVDAGGVGSVSASALDSTLQAQGTTFTSPAISSVPANNVVLGLFEDYANSDQSFTAPSGWSTGTTTDPYWTTSEDCAGAAVDWTQPSSTASVTATITSSLSQYYYGDALDLNPTSPAPVNSVLPVISGTAGQGDTLSTTNGTWSNSPTGYTYKWSDCNSSGANCTSISGATSPSYTVGTSDVGSTILSSVTASNADGSTSASSAATDVIPSQPPPAAPVNSALPVISGTAQQGDALSATNGSWSNSPTSYVYQWRDCSASGSSCSNISGATSSSYTVAASDVGDTVDVVVTAKNAGGSTPATSAQTQTVTAATSGEQSVTFWLGWSGAIQESQIPWNAVTQVDLFALKTTDGTA
ncbi:MAG: hypothetical protein ACLP0J_18415, partial [Solirubrobacteraceae bacterium]